MCIFKVSCYKYLECFDDSDYPIEVNTLYGDVIGSLKLYRYASFQGIPFASPPVGELRLKPPIDPSPWAEPLDVSGNSTKVCPQLSGTTSGDVIGEEDCLYLNIYSPALAKGTSNGWHLNVFALLSQDIIVVTVN